MVRPTNWNILRFKVYERDNYTCVKCSYKHNPDYWKEARKKNLGAGFDLVADHILPMTLGGHASDLSNLQTLCIWCNKTKNAKDQSDIAKFKREEKLKMFQRKDE